MRVILASASPRRADLLRAAGVAFETVVSDIDEAIRPGEAPSAYVQRLASEKSAAAMAALSAPDAVILGADTAVVVDGDVLGKPRDNADATAMLRRLSGRAHEVMTGISLRRTAIELVRVEITAVFVSPLSEDDVAWYVASGEGRDKAGAYAIQGLASRFIPRIEGSYSNVVGLPVEAAMQMLTEIGNVYGRGARARARRYRNT
jgi:septum formation protein